MEVSVSMVRCISVICLQSGRMNVGGGHEQGNRGGVKQR